MVWSLLANKSAILAISSSRPAEGSQNTLWPTSSFCICVCPDRNGVPLYLVGFRMNSGYSWMVLVGTTMPMDKWSKARLESDSPRSGLCLERTTSNCFSPSCACRTTPYQSMLKFWEHQWIVGHFGYFFAMLRPMLVGGSLHLNCCRIWWIAMCHYLSLQSLHSG